MKCETADRWWNIEFNYVLKCKLGDPLGSSLILNFDWGFLLLYYYVCMYVCVYVYKDILKQSPRKACVCYEMIGSTASQERVKSA